MTSSAHVVIVLAILLLQYGNFFGLASEELEEINLEAVMGILLRRCSVVLYSHEQPEEFHVSRCNHQLGERTLKTLNAFSIPVTHRVVKRNEDFDSVRLERYLNSKVSCHTFLWFLHPTFEKTTQEYVLYPQIWMDYARHPEKSESDYAILGYEDIRGVRIKIDFEYPNFDATRFPDNLFFFRGKTQLMEMNQAGIILSSNFEKDFILVALGRAQFYCPSLEYSCIYWYNYDSIKGVAGGKFPIKDCGTYLLPLGTSAHFAPKPWNLNKAPLFNIDFGLYADEKYFSSIRKFSFRQGIFPGNNPFADWKTPRYSTIAAWTWIMFEIMEGSFNGSVEDHGSQFKSRNFSFPVIAGHPSPVFKYLSQEIRMVVFGHTNLNFCCTRHRRSALDFSTMFYPMDSWTWISVFTSFAFLAITFWKHTKSPIFNLISIFFAQGDGDAVQRFKAILTLWSFVGLLVTSGFSGMIGSLLVVPPVRDDVKDFQQLYEQGFRLLWSSRFVHLSPWKMGGYRIIQEDAQKNSENSYFQRQYHLMFQLDQGMELIDAGLYSIEFFNYMTKMQKRCVMVDETVTSMIANVIVQFHPNQVVYSGEKPLASFLPQWVLRNPKAPLLYEGLMTLYATGVLDYYDRARRRVGEFHHLKQLHVALQKLSTFSKARSLLYHVTSEEDWMQFSIRNSQGQMIFYGWLILIAFVLALSILDIAKAKCPELFSKRASLTILLQTTCRPLKKLSMYCSTQCKHKSRS